MLSLSAYVALVMESKHHQRMYDLIGYGPAVRDGLVMESKHHQRMYDLIGHGPAVLNNKNTKDARRYRIVSRDVAPVEHIETLCCAMLFNDCLALLEHTSLL